jgi:hypothetical protein
VLEKMLQKFQSLQIVPGAQLKQAQSMLIFERAKRAYGVSGSIKHIQNVVSVS